MNDAPTPAKTTGYDASFADGAAMSVTGNTSITGAALSPSTINSRRDPRGFQGSSRQPLRKGVKYLFRDEPGNHPAIPFSGQRNLTANSPDVSTNPAHSNLNPTPLVKNPTGKV